jgi:hypothetical protein
LRKRSNQPLAWQIMKLMPGFAAGYCVPPICLEAIAFPSRKNFWRRAAVSDAANLNATFGVVIGLGLGPHRLPSAFGDDPSIRTVYRSNPGRRPA